jgi:uncharacterized repeat protein (TIGR01451 family)
METGAMSAFTAHSDSRAFRSWLALVLLALALGQTARAAQTYNLVDLGVLGGGTYSIARGLDGKGRVAGVAGDASGAPRAFLHDGAKLLDIAAASGASAAEAFAVNGLGQATGYFLPPGETLKHAFIYQNGVLRDLGPIRPGAQGDESQGIDINASGQIAGYSVCNANASTAAICPPDRAFYYDGAPHDPGELDVNHPRAYAYAINDLGQIAGVSFDGKGLRRAFLYDASGMSDIGDLGAGASVALDINNRGHVVGYADAKRTGANGAEFIVSHAFIYKNGAMHDLGALSGSFYSSEARGINGKDQVVGVSGGSAFLYDGGKLYDLNALVDDRQGWTITDAAAINEAGQIAANGTNAAGEKHALLLTPATSFQASAKVPKSKASQLAKKAPADTDVTQTVDLSIQTFTGTPNPATAPNALTYTAIVRNGGPLNASNVKLAVTLPNSVNFVSASPSAANCANSANNGIATVVCALGTVNAGTNSTTVSIVATPTLIGALNAVATASATETDADPSNNQLSIVTNVNNATPAPANSADLAIAFADAPDPVVIGNPLTYSVDVTNAGPATATFAQLAVTLPNGVSLASGLGAGCVSSGPVAPAQFLTVVCALGNIAPNSKITQVIIVTTPNAGVIAARAAVTAREIDPNLANNSVSTSTAVVAQTADLAVSLAGPSSGTVGNALSYTATVLNNGPNGASDARLAITLPNGASFVSGPAICVPSGNTNINEVVCNIGGLNAGGTVSVTFAVTPTLLGNIALAASASALETDSNPANNQASFITSIQGQIPGTGSADLSLSVIDSPDPVTVGHSLTYTADIVNLGPNTATNINLNLAIPENMTIKTAVPVGVDQRVTTTTSISDFVDCATERVPAVLPPGQTQTFPTTGGPPIVACPGITIFRYDNSQTPEYLSGNQTLITTTITYSLTPSVFNGRIITIVVDEHSYGCFFGKYPKDVFDNGGAGNNVFCEPLGVVAPGGRINPVIVLTPTQTGDFTVVGSVSSAQKDPNLANNVTNAVTTVTTASADLSIANLSVAPQSVSVDGALTYTVTIANKGRSDAANAQLVLSLPDGVTLFSSIPQVCAQRGNGAIGCNLGQILSGASLLQTIVVTPTRRGTINASATVFSDEVDPDQSNNQSSVSATAIAPENNPTNLKVTLTDDPDPVSVEGAFSYIAKVENISDIDASNVQLKLTLPEGVSVASVAPALVPATDTSVAYGCSIDGNAVSCQLGTLIAHSGVSPVIVATSAKTGVITAIASVSSSQKDSDLNDNLDQTDTTVVGPATALSVNLSATPDPATIGQLLTYTVTAINTSASDAENVQLTVNLPDSVNVTNLPDICARSGAVLNCILGNIPAGARTAVPIAVTPTRAGDITATASLTANTFTGNKGSVTTSVRDLTDDLLKVEFVNPADNGEVKLGDLIAYQPKIANVGDIDAPDTRLNLTLPASVSVVAVTPAFAPATATLPAYGCTINGSSVSCLLGNLAAHRDVTPVITAAPSQTGDIVAIASVSSSQTEFKLDNNQALTKTVVVGLPTNLNVVLSADPDPVIAGDSLIYTVGVVNISANDATGASVAIALPGGADIVSVPDVCVRAGANLDCSLGTIAAGGRIDLPIVVTPKQGGTLNLTATAKADTFAGNPVSLSTKVLDATVDLAVTVASSADEATAGFGVLTYTVLVSNTDLGIVTADKTSVTLNLSGPDHSVVSASSGCAIQGTSVTCFIGSLPVGASDAVQIRIIPNQAGILVANATVDWDQKNQDSNLLNNQDSLQTPVNVYAPPNMDLSVSLSATPSPVPIGDKLTYRAALFNDGPNTATHVRAILTLPESGVEFVAADEGCAPVENTVVCDFEDLIAGARSARLITVKPTQDFAINGVVSVSAREGDANAGNNVATLQTAVATGTSAPDANVSLLLLAPNGGEEWTVGSDQNVSWRLNGIDQRRFLTVSLSRDGGATWKFLRRIASDSFDGLDLRVRDAYVGEHIRIRVCLSKGRGVFERVCDISDRDFSIAR